MDNTVLVGLVGAGAAVLGAGLTTLGSYLSSRLQTGSLDRQLEADAQHRAAERRDARMDSWRERRLAGHEAFLDALNVTEADVRARCHEFREAIRLRRDATPPDYLEAEVFRELREARSRMVLVASDAAREAADDVLEALRRRLGAWAFAYSAGEMGAHNLSPTDGQLGDALEEVEAAKAAYLQAAKDDLGSRD